MDRDEKRPAGANGEPREIFNWTNSNIAPDAGKVKPLQTFVLLPDDHLCGRAAGWLAANRFARIFWIADGANLTAAGLVLMTTDEVIVATTATDELVRAAEAATSPDRTIAVIVAPVERVDEWITVARWCGLIARRWA